MKHIQGSQALTSEELLMMLTAVAHPLRLRVIAELAGGRVHVSELARRLGMSRPLLYMHLDRLEKAGLVIGHLELSEDGKAMKFFELAPFELRVTADTIVEALRAEDAEGAGDSAARIDPDNGTDAHDMEESDR
jgi:DNA-binding transcriptional ArsR family regulator